MDADHDGRCEEPIWLLMTAGWLLASLVIARPGAALDPLAIEERLPSALGPADDLDTMCLRDLCRLPGIGPARGLAIARARWEQGLRGAPQAWDVVPGIGPQTIEGLREWQAQRSAGASGSGNEVGDARR
jgi:hypothetical protein